MSDVVAISNAAADAAGLPRLLLLACAVAESDLRIDARRPKNAADDERYWPDVSFGAWQQTIRWSTEHLKACSKAGTDPARFPGSGAIESIGQIYTDPEYAAGVAASGLKAKYRPSEPDAIFRALCRYNWPAGDGEPVDDATAANYRRGIAEAEQILKGQTAPTSAARPPAYNLDQPTEIQRQDWACAIRTATWVLKSLGVDTDAGRMQDAMVPRFVTPQLGLLDARGYGLADAIKAQLPSEWHGRVHVLESLGWDNLKAVVGRGPVALGGRSWGIAGHWTAVRRMQADGTLALANPAPGYQGVGDSLSRAQWDQLGPWSAVWVSAEPAAVVGPPADELATLRQQVVSLTAQLEDKARRLDTEVSKNGFAAGDLADALQAIVNTLRSLRPPAA